jgi:hypothetical protein
LVGVGEARLGGIRVGASPGCMHKGPGSTTRVWRLFMPPCVGAMWAMPSKSMGLVQGCRRWVWLGPAHASRS